MKQTIKTNLTQNHDFLERSESFGIEKLQKSISNLYGLEKSAEIKLLATFFIEQLANNLELLHKPIKIESGDNNNLFSVTSCPDLPSDFPDGAEMPLYLYGDLVCDRSLEVCGTVIGRFYAFERNLEQWRWKYLIFANQVSAFPTYIYWETELLPLD